MEPSPVSTNQERSGNLRPRWTLRRDVHQGSKTQDPDSKQNEKALVSEISPMSMDGETSEWQGGEGRGATVNAPKKSEDSSSAEVSLDLSYVQATRQNALGSTETTKEEALSVEDEVANTRNNSETQEKSGEIAECPTNDNDTTPASPRALKTLGPRQTHQRMRLRTQDAKSPRLPRAGTFSTGRKISNFRAKTLRSFTSRDGSHLSLRASRASSQASDLDGESLEPSPIERVKGTPWGISESGSSHRLARSRTASRDSASSTSLFAAITSFGKGGSQQSSSDCSAPRLRGSNNGDGAVCSKSTEESDAQSDARSDSSGSENEDESSGLPQRRLSILYDPFIAYSSHANSPSKMSTLEKINLKLRKESKK